MQRVKAELLILSREAQDKGTDEQLSGHIDIFLKALTSLLTERMINSMQPVMLRALYRRWHELVHLHDFELEPCIAALSARIWVSISDREIIETPASDKVASIFSGSKTTH